MFRSNAVSLRAAHNSGGSVKLVSRDLEPELGKTGPSRDGPVFIFQTMQRWGCRANPRPATQPVHDATGASEDNFVRMTSSANPAGSAVAFAGSLVASV